MCRNLRAPREHLCGLALFFWWGRYVLFTETKHTGWPLRGYRVLLLKLWLTHLLVPYVNVAHRSSPDCSAPQPWWLSLQLPGAADLQLSCIKYWYLICQEWSEAAQNEFLDNTEVTVRAWNMEIFLGKKNMYLTEQLFMKETISLVIGPFPCSLGVEDTVGKWVLGLPAGQMVSGTPSWKPVLLAFERLCIHPEAKLPCWGCVHCSGSSHHSTGAAAWGAPMTMYPDSVLSPRDGRDLWAQWGTQAHSPCGAHSPAQTFCLCLLPRGSPLCQGQSIPSRRDDMLLSWGGSFQRGMSQHSSKPNSSFGACEAGGCWHLQMTNIPEEG